MLACVAMPRPNPSRSLAVLALAGLAFSLAQTMIVPALGDMKTRLGTDEHPYSKGLMARALMRAGVGVERAYELARRIEQDLAARGERTADIDRIQELAADVLGVE